MENEISKRCPSQAICSGCDNLHLDELQQKLAKLDFFKKNFNSPLEIPIEFHSFGIEFLRSRLDFVIENGKIGLYHKDGRSSGIVDIETCLQLEPNLQKFYSSFRKLNLPIKKGSVRLRVSPTGELGTWLDFFERRY